VTSSQHNREGGRTVIELRRVKRQSGMVDEKTIPENKIYNRALDIDTWQRSLHREHHASVTEKLTIHARVVFD
jgi:hypothetical protein